MDAETIPKEAGHYLVLFRMREGHSYVSLVRGANLTEAIANYVVGFEERAAKEANGAILVDAEHSDGKRMHPLQYIESEYKRQGEWQIRRLREVDWKRAYADALVGEHPNDVQEHIDRCRPLLYEESGIRNAPAFLWYLTDGVLVTFYRRKKGDLQLIARYRRAWDDSENVRRVTPSYDEIAELLFV